MRPLTLQNPEAAAVRALWLGNLVALAVLAAGAFALAPLESALSVLMGGAIALANFRLLEHNVRRSLHPARSGKPGVVGAALVRYYLRFLATAAVIFVLIRQGLAEPVGLLLGLSVVIISIFAWGAVQARKLYKEAD
jgi:hypothetical protein